jgi:hypothetical protein
MRTTLSLAVFTAALALSGQRSYADHDHHGEAFEKCARECSDCQRACDSCAAHCARMIAEGKKEHLKTLGTCQDCATHCSAAACIVSRQGPFSDLICQACAEACARCGKACEAHPEDAHMKKCAEECRKCEKACREMLKHVEKGSTTKARAERK